ncbi:META domain-containing protein [Lishizhenia tianjinensis]|uniref:META domain-containing protein n=1 Tax=Lishizhenia tianjinensis TaxID=477690 RepID=A0A1I7BFA4_9FLAO|nr:DUF4377 domain-containing protein [Lishizhenia tianjinensis]SFT85879.1 META domain-containing protein [Lishizhenia tianjinensis]
MKLLQIVLTLSLLTSCGLFKSKADTQTMWVNSFKTDCTGVGPQQCLLIQHGDSLGNNWSNFYDQIEGFTYEPGYIYELEVKKTVLDPANVPADASTIKYSLVKEISKTMDVRLQIHDIYVITNISGYGELKDLSLAPTMEINVTQNRISGKDACNTYGAQIENLNATDISFGMAMATKMYCQETMPIADAFHKVLGQVKHYQRKEGFLYLMNEERKVILTLKKVD